MLRILMHAQGPAADAAAAEVAGLLPLSGDDVDEVAIEAVDQQAAGRDGDELQQ
jgi:hypothetical protein